MNEEVELTFDSDGNISEVWRDSPGRIWMS
jgi:hypothetical protein